MRIRSIGFGGLALALVLLAPAVRAQPIGTLERYRPSETPDDLFEVSRPDVPGHLRLGAQLHLSYAYKPLVFRPTTGSAISVVAHEGVGTLGFSLGLADRAVVFAGLPVVFLMSGSTSLTLAPYDVAPADPPGLGDLYLGGRVRLVGDREAPFTLSAQATLTAPTAILTGPFFYRGDLSFSAHPELLFEVRPGWKLRVTANAGVRFRQQTSSVTSNLAFGHELTYAASIARPLWNDANNEKTELVAALQAFGGLNFNALGGVGAVPFEALAGLQLHANGEWHAGIGAGMGIVAGFGSPAFRGVATVGWTPIPAEPEPEPEPEPEKDSDGDGLLDSADACPTEAEDVDQFEDEDGCPDKDNDTDAVLDADDGCPMDAEDRDEFEDEDGCPDPDNDQDGIEDGKDGCPIEAGPKANRGCPDTDRDGDTVVDRLDNCPDEPGPPENKGCAKKQRVEITDGSLKILEKILFKTDKDKILRQSFSLLDNVASVINAHPEIKKIWVEGHTDDRGSAEHNLDLSRRRAAAVVEYLVTKGKVDASRLESRGYGSAHPIVPNATSKEDLQRNRRVDFSTVAPEERGLGDARPEGAEAGSSEAPPEGGSTEH